MPKNKEKGMVDTSAKKVTKRKAIAQSVIVMSEKAFEFLESGSSPKGDVFETARVAAVMAAKNTPQILPMCHPLEIQKVGVRFQLNQKKRSVTTYVEVFYVGRTGVEMEALCAASSASLTIYDMLKSTDPSMTIVDTYLVEKKGGRRGLYQRKKDK